MNDMGMGQGAAPGGQAVDPQDAEKNKLMAALSYWTMLWFVPFFMARQSPFVKFHLNQGIAIWLIFIVGTVVSSVLGMISGMLAMVGSLIYLVGVIFACLGAWNAWSGKATPLPVIGGMIPTIIK